MDVIELTYKQIRDIYNAGLDQRNSMKATLQSILVGELSKAEQENWWKSFAESLRRG